MKFLCGEDRMHEAVAVPLPDSLEISSIKKCANETKYNAYLFIFYPGVLFYADWYAAHSLHAAFLRSQAFYMP